MNKTIPNLAIEIIKKIGDYTINENENEEIIDIEEIPTVLRMIADDYQNCIKKERL